MTSLTISIEHKDSYELATELVLALQESRAVVNPVSAPQTDSSKTTLDFPELQNDARERIMREASNWANAKGLKSVQTEDDQNAESEYLTIRQVILFNPIWTDTFLIYSSFDGSLGLESFGHDDADSYRSPNPQESYRPPRIRHHQIPDFFRR